MLLEHTEKDNVMVVKLLEKRLDAHIAVSFKEKLAGFIEQGHTRILLDMAAVEFIDSSGLGAIVSVLKQAGTKNGELMICSLQDATLSMFKLTRMDKVFNIYAQESDALAAAA